MLMEQVSNLIGKPGGVTMFEVEKGAIRRFAEAVGDPNPVYRDEEYARKSRYGTIIAPPGFFGWPTQPATGSALLVDFQPELIEAMAKEGYSLASALDAGIEYDFHQPLRAGDTLAATTALKDLRERTGRTGKMVIFIMETSYINQHGNLVASARATYILRSLSM